MSIEDSAAQGGDVESGGGEPDESSTKPDVRPRKISEDVVGESFRKSVLEERERRNSIPKCVTPDAPGGAKMGSDDNLKGQHTRTSAADRQSRKSNRRSSLPMLVHELTVSHLEGENDRLELMGAPHRTRVSPIRTGRRLVSPGRVHVVTSPPPMCTPPS